MVKSSSATGLSLVIPAASSGAQGQQEQATPARTTISQTVNKNLIQSMQVSWDIM